MTAPPTIATEHSTKERERWNSRTAFLVASIGSSIGLGNLWRFPHSAQRYGGAAFLLVFIPGAIFLGLPMLVSEFCLGKVVKGGNAAAFASLSPRWAGIGYAAPWTALMTAPYYSTIIAYACVFFVRSLTPGGTPWEEGDGSAAMSVMEKSQLFWEEEILQLDKNPSNFTGLVWPIVAALLFVFVMIYLAIFKGVKVTGNVVYVTAALPVLLICVLVGVGSSLDGASDGITAYIGRADLSVLYKSPAIYPEAIGQVFFSLGTGLGVMCSYASFSSTKHNAVQDACVVALADTIVALLCGAAVFSVLGFLAKQSGVEVGELPSGGMGLAFKTYPVGLMAMPQYTFARILVALFFLTLILLGIDSAFSQVDSWVTVLHEAKLFAHTKRWKFILVTCGLLFLFSLCFATHTGLFLVETFDWYIGSCLFVVNGFTQAVAIGWSGREETWVAQTRSRRIFGVFYVGGSILGAVLTFGVFGGNFAGVASGLITFCLMSATGLAIGFKTLRCKSAPALSEGSAVWELLIGSVERLRAAINVEMGVQDSFWKLPMFWSILNRYIFPPVLAILVIVSATTKFGTFHGLPTGYQAAGGGVVMIGFLFIIVGFLFPSLFDKLQLLPVGFFQEAKRQKEGRPKASKKLQHHGPSRLDTVVPESDTRSMRGHSTDIQQS